MAYLPYNTDFTDLPVLEQPKQYPNWIPCTACKQHGKHVLKLNAYGLGVHFCGGCQNCNGWGWVDPALNCPHPEGHKFVTVKSSMRGESVWRCQNCNLRINVDSSD
jgi:ssDNA-binding Zn-finger/Zn-ribbon topoisomerase 1